MSFWDKIVYFFSNFFDKLISFGGAVLARGVFVVSIVAVVFGFYYNVILIINVLNGNMHKFCKTVITLVLVGVIVFALVVLVPYVKGLIDTLNAL